MRARAWQWNLPAYSCATDQDWMREDGARIITGEGGGQLVFRPDGRAEAHWIETAAIAASHNSGRRKTRILEKAAAGGPVSYTDLFRRLHQLSQAFGDRLAEAPDLKIMEVNQDLLWPLLRAASRLDVEAVEEVAHTLRLLRDIKSGRLETPTRGWDDMARAIRIAAEKFNGIPTRMEVVETYRKEAGANIGAKEDLRDTLSRMGFGWLPAPAGRPRKK